MKGKPCFHCGQKVVKDVIALNKKMLGRYTNRFLCITCLAQYLGCAEEDLRNKIEELKELGCTLFA